MIIIAALSLGLVPVLAGCGSSSSSSKSGGSTETNGSGGGEGGKKTIAGIQANDHGTKTASLSEKTEVELDDYYFEPTVIRGSAGQKVKLELKNEGKTTHTFTIDSEKINKELAPGDEAEVTVTIPKSGVVSFYCRFHKSSGMAGALAVNGASVSGGMNQSTTMNTSTGTGTDPGIELSAAVASCLGCRSWKVRPSSRPRRSPSSRSTAAS